MRVVSLVPSLTETLLLSGANVVGRTRYCLYPETKIQKIPIVGGTKNLDLKILSELNPDLLLLDKEENLPWMKEQAPCEVHTFHATSVQSMEPELLSLAAKFSDLQVSQNLISRAQLWSEIAKYSVWQVASWQRTWPGEIKRTLGELQELKYIIYLIWNKPLMSVHSETFIGSILTQLGLKQYQPQFLEKYPRIDLSDFSPTNTLLLLSTEPYPFAEKWDQLPAQMQPYTKILVDGESYSWFGDRSLKFLQETLKSL